MKEIARLSDTDRADLFRNTASRMALTDAIVEKDYWVCYTLDFLFHRCDWSSALTFKGGTSLSKAFHLIQRFSEDIDLILDWRVLGYGWHEPWAQRSNTKQDAFNKEADLRAETFIREEFMPNFKEAISGELGRETTVSIEESNKQAIIFEYPRLFSSTSTLQAIRLEIGALAAWTPAQSAIITSYAAEQYRRLFSTPDTEVLTVAPERTFWEKATILHQEANRPNHLSMPPRYSRHYYDLYKMSVQPIKDLALADSDLLRRVVDFKTKFYPRSWAKYPDAVAGKLRLVPDGYRFCELSKDYEDMREMLFGEIPTLEEIMSGLEILEQEVNTRLG